MGICLKFKFLCSKTDFLKKKYPKFLYTQKKKHVHKDYKNILPFALCFDMYFFIKT